MDWRERLTRGYLRVMDSRWGFFLFGRVLPSTFFLWGFYFGLGRFPDAAAILANPTPGGVFVLVQESLGRMIGLSQVVLFAVRKQVIGRRASLLGAAVALAASYYANFGIFFNTFGLRPPAPREEPLQSGIAALMGLVGTAIIAVSFPYLGRHIGIFPEVRGLTTSGPYRLVRHPLYVAYLLGAAGGLLLAPSLEAVVVFGLYYALVVWRAAFEERALEEVFGEQYRAYMRRTPGVAPEPLAAWLRARVR